MREVGKPTVLAGIAWITLVSVFVFPGIEGGIAVGAMALLISATASFFGLRASLVARFADKFSTGQRVIGTAGCLSALLLVTLLALGLAGVFDSV